VFGITNRMPLKHNIVYSIVGTIAQRGLTLVSGIIIARVAGAEFLGQYAVLLSTVFIFGAFATFGIAPSAAKYIAENKDNDKLKTSKIIYITAVTAVVIGFVLFLIVFGSSYFIVDVIYQKPELFDLLRIISPLILLYSLTAFQNGVLAGFGEFSSIAKINIISGIINFTLFIIAFYWFDLIGVIIALLCGQVVNNYLLYLRVKFVLSENEIIVSRSGATSEIQLLTQFGAPSFLVGIIQGVANWVCVILLTRQESGVSLMADYHIMNQWYSLILFIPNVASNVILPFLSNLHKNESNNVHNSVIELIKSYGVASFIATIFLIIFTPIIVQIYGEKFGDLESLFVLTFVTGFVVALKSPLEQYLAAADKAWMLLVIHIVFVSIYLSGAYLWIDYGVTAVLVAKLIGYIVFFIFSWFLFQNLRKS